MELPETKQTIGQLNCVPKIEPINERIYNTLNNGVYKSGFASTQDAYDRAVAELFGTLDWLDKRLASRRYLIGEQVTEAD
jgi:putative glutathione S-transferase